MKVKCSRCGQLFNPADGCADVFVKNEVESELGFTFTIKAHGSGDGTPTATLCIGCLAEWLKDCNIEESMAKKIAEQYKTQMVEGNHVVG